MSGYKLEEFRKYLEMNGFDKETINKYISFLQKMSILWKEGIYTDKVEFTEEEIKFSDEVFGMYYSAEFSLFRVNR